MSLPTFNLFLSISAALQIDVGKRRWRRGRGRGWWRNDNCPSRRVARTACEGRNSDKVRTSAFPFPTVPSPLLVRLPFYSPFISAS
ncbi:hypothetical protein K438DRAFT_912305 [Mycena galopus ATCC 62051]|nr:hypothetical protein K438DRAFT_912305 [Mycena galopus ATCC 62051]